MCAEEKLARYRPEVLTDSNYEADKDIEQCLGFGICNGDHRTQWTTEADHAINLPCPTCGLLFAPWASEDMTTAKFKSDNGIVDLQPSPQLDLFK